MKRFTTLQWIILFSIAKLIFHIFTNAQYGFHRDELATLDDSRHPAWGYVAYPPLTPFIGRVALELFGESLTGFRFFAAAAQCVVIVLAALMARRFGGDGVAQWLAAGAVAVSPVSLAASALFQYVSFDFLWWVLISYLTIRLAESQNPKWWIPIGAVIGLGVLTKYTIAFFVAGIVIGTLFSPLRAHLKSRALWIGVALSLLIAAPNLIWQSQNDFVSLDFLRSIHERDVEIGRTDGFLLQQLFVPANATTIPIWLTGLVALFIAPRFRTFRLLGIAVVITFVIFLLAEGRSYYTAPLFPVLLAAGAAQITLWAAQRTTAVRRTVIASLFLLIVIGSGVAAIALPIAPIGSKWWKTALEMNGDFREEFGWPEMTAEVARIWGTLPESERSRTAILCANYGEAGAINLYGPHHGLPPAISTVNSFWARGYGNPPPETVIALGRTRESLEQSFEQVTLAGRIPNPLGIENEESQRPEIYLCRKPRRPWSEVWPSARRFG